MLYRPFIHYYEFKYINVIFLYHIRCPLSQLNEYYNHNITIFFNYITSFNFYKGLTNCHHIQIEDPLIIIFCLLYCMSALYKKSENHSLFIMIMMLMKQLEFGLLICGQWPKGSQFRFHLLLLFSVIGLYFHK